MADGYSGYNAVCNNNNITRQGCWAHARRKFIGAQKLNGGAGRPKGKTGKADQGLAFIQSLYRIEQTLKNKAIEEKCIARQQQSQLILDRLKAWLEKSLPLSPPQSPIGKALYYLHNQWPHLINYVCDGDYPIDNNAAENAIRPFVIGLKNWLFSASQNGATATTAWMQEVEQRRSGCRARIYTASLKPQKPMGLSLMHI